MQLTKEERALKRELTALYHRDRKTLAEIGSLFNVSAQSIYYWMRKFEIERRPRGRPSRAS
jgi:transposase-like protein